MSNALLQEVTMPNDFKKSIYSCPCETCRALVRLVKDRGAKLLFSRDRAGRLCELAVVAAAGEQGIPEGEVVAKRRVYAEHVQASLHGPTCDSDEPVHIRWAIGNSNHNPNATHRINLGQARASQDGDRFRLR